MKLTFTQLARMAAIITIAAICVLSSAQAPAPTQPDALIIKLAMNSDRVHTCEQPCVVLTIYNVSDKWLRIAEGNYRLYVEGVNGEPHSTVRLRQMNNTMQPGDRPLMITLFADEPMIPNGQSIEKRFQLPYYYDLSAIGKYFAHVDVKDPLTQRWLRTNTVQFEITTPIPARQ
jgi:hypothetical protein